MLDFVFYNSTSQKKYNSGFFRNTLLEALEQTGMNQLNVGLSVNLVGDAKIRSLNLKYRNKDKATDVLSFPLSTEINAKKSKDAILELGDIFICPDVAVQKARENERNLDDEMNFLVVHGFLHLLGYDHEKSKKEETKMFQLQDKILSKLK